MPSPIKMRTDYSAPQLRVLAKSPFSMKRNLCKNRQRGHSHVAKRGHSHVALTAS